MPIPEDLIERLETCHGLSFQRRGEKLTLSCPLPSHADAAPSAVVFLNTGRFHCSACTPGASLSLLELRELLDGESEDSSAPGDARSLTSPVLRTRAPTGAHRFRQDDTREIWQLALERMTDDHRVSGREEQATYAYLASRGLLDVYEERLFGIVTSDLKLPDACRRWPQDSYHLVVPLYDVQTGELASIQARTIDEAVRPRTRFPRGARASGVVFANAMGLQVLRGGRPGLPVILGEGLTDFLALSLSSYPPVLAVPGVAAASSAIGPWAEGRDIRIAFDTDAAGDAVVPQVVRKIYRAGGHSVVRTRWPRGAKDACDALQLLGAEGFAEMLLAWERSPRRTKRAPGRLAKES